MSTKRSGAFATARDELSKTREKIKTIDYDSIPPARQDGSFTTLTRDFIGLAEHTMNAILFTSKAILSTAVLTADLGEEYVRSIE